eukprot:m.125961 g.125961  ORF g.125961 m.125961 type:complete len:392 (-) comp16326_c0_seq1:1649-2824(-)
MSSSAAEELRRDWRLKAQLAGRSVLVTGAAGYVGRRLARELLALDVGYLALTDLVLPPNRPEYQDPRVSLFPGDIRNKADVLQAMKTCQFVFHVASYGMSGNAMLDVDTIRAVNVQGTKNVLEACRENSVPYLIYVSTYNVVFHGQEIINGNNSLPFVPDDKHEDEYSRTKAIAEQYVLSHSSVATRTCSIRPAAIYGEGEERHMPRIVRMINWGLGFFAIGSRSILCDWVYVDNLVHGMLCAAASLAENRDGVSGHAFHIADGQPVNNFEFIKEVLGQPSLFWLRMPSSVMFSIATLFDNLSRALPSSMRFTPFLTKGEVCKVGYTHYMDMREAQQQIGYVPVVEHKVAVARTRAFFEDTVASQLTQNLLLLSYLLCATVLPWYLYTSLR